LNRSSGACGIPRLAIKWCLEHRGVNLSDVEIVASPGRLLRKALREAKFQLRLGLTRPGRSEWARSIGGTFREVAQLAEIRRLAGKSRSFLEFEHHLCHAASAYYPSEFDRALILTLDENGDMWSGLVAVGENEEIRPLRVLRFPNSLGWFHSRVTEFLGLRPRLDEHKVQWLSKDGQPEFVGAFRKLFRRDAEGPLSISAISAEPPLVAALSPSNLARNSAWIPSLSLQTRLFAPLWHAALAS
jgi:carbamoyltransferase